MSETKVKLAIREFAVPCPRTGSIDVNSGYGNSQLQGTEIHAQVQKKRAEEDPSYRPEVKIHGEFLRENYCFVVEGRMDGLFESAVPKIEEIKSSFSIHELYKTLKNQTYTHPYCIQLLTYGYFYYLEHKVVPELSFHLVSSRNFESRDLELHLDVVEYEAWLETRLAELVKETIRIEKRTAKRKKMAMSFRFPFENPRPGQIELIKTTEEGIAEHRPMLIQAPTGLGKTAGVLYPTLKEALSRGQRVVYVTPKNSQHSVAEDAVERFQETGTPVKSLTITAKSKMCMKAEPLCNPTYCEYARDYYDKLAQNELVEALGKKKKLSSKVFKAMAEKYEVCPFELQLDAANEADAIICDYNYVFGARSALGRIPQTSFAQDGKPSLVIDEAHNLPSRAMGYYSPSLSSFFLEKMRDEVKVLPKRFSRDALEILDECIDVLKRCGPEGANKTVRIDPPLGLFLEQDQKLRGLLSQYLDSDIEIRPKDVVLKLCFYWGEFTEMLAQISGLDRPEFFVTFQPEKTGGAIKITCCDASEMLKSSYDEYEHVVGFSATLKPFDYYSRLSGLKEKNLKIAEFQSPFEKENRKLLIIPQISTKYSERERNYARIAETISRVAALKNGNHLAFFPSFDFLERVAAIFDLPQGFRMIKQERHMRIAEIESILEHLKSEVEPTLVFAVQGGVFSEGVDYPGNMVLGAFVVGPPLPHFDVEHETMRKYYQDHYQEGFDYAYAYPAMAKAVQAAGRVIRSENDRGVIVLMDSRFLEAGYVKSMPKDWFRESPIELVSRSILKDVSDFWAEGLNENP